MGETWRTDLNTECDTPDPCRQILFRINDLNLGIGVPTLFDETFLYFVFMRSWFHLLFEIRVVSPVTGLSSESSSLGIYYF